MGAFVAKYRGRCAADCDDPVIVPGDRVLFVDDELVHEECEAEGLVAAEGRHGAHRVAEVCTRCWLVRPCPCDDERSAA